ncbi:5'/3'-nucleotidase SurE [Comamonas sp. GB3 AK4-5]|uniref:5'/3'-nucleotidase SurE n=1 Tax=Comamonas sp. GB3 AK4-5 TaxID=3231487 RepID=UPI00351E3992
MKPFCFSLAVVAAATALFASPATALNILITNDDGLTSNVKALYDTLRSAGHDVLVSLPCSPQSGRSGAIVMYSSSTIDAEADPQIRTENGCHNGAAPVGAPAAGPFTKAGYTQGDWHYVHGTPVTATFYGLDIVGKQRWGKAPDLVLSGPNEGQNIGAVIIHSGTVANAQAALGRGIPAMALSADADTADDTGLANPRSKLVAQLTLQLLDRLIAQRGNGPLLPQGMALNVNFPASVTSHTAFAFSRIGSYQGYEIGFSVERGVYGLSFAPNRNKPTSEQMEDESAVARHKVAVSAMQFAYEQRPAAQEWLRQRLQSTR